MSTAKQYLIKAIEEHKDELVERICNRLQKFSQSHYETIAFEQLQEREEMFLNVLLQTLRDDNSASFPLYVRKLVEQRANEGYSLKEVEEAFDIIEDTLWEMVVKYCPLEESLIEVLALIKELFHKFKNTFAQMFYDEALKAEKQFGEIRKKFAEYRSESDVEK